MPFHVIGKFQFHKGAIKRGQGVGALTSAAAFQFHKGAIKRSTADFGRRYTSCSFNSIKVRLKASVRGQPREHKRFQFHKGAIKSLVSAVATTSPTVSIP